MMFKTEGYIEKFAKLLTDQMEMENYTKEQVCIAIEEVLKDFQKDLLESASKGKEEAWISYRKGEGHSFGHKEALDYGWQAAKLSSMKEIQEKDEEITELKRALQLIYDNSRANYIDKQEKEKFRQVVEKYKLHKY